MYSFLFLCFLIETMLGKGKRYECFVVSLFSLLSIFLLASLRWKTGNDWQAYYDFYNNAAEFNYQEQSYEIGFRALVQFCKVLSLDYTGFLVVVTFLQLIGFYLLFLKTRAPSLCILLFFSTYFLGYISTIRQAIAISMCLISFVFYLERKQKIAIFFVVIAFLFHFSSLVFFAVYFVPKKIKSIVFYALYLVVMMMLSIFIIPTLLDFIFGHISGIPLISKLHDYYTIKSDLGEQTSLIYVWYLKRVMMIIFFYTLVRFVIPTHAYFFNLYLLGATIFFIFINIVPMLGLRGAEYFNIFEVVLLALSINAIRGSIYLKLILVVVFSVPRLYSTIYNYHPELYVPYYSVFEKSEAIRQMY